MRTNIVAFLLVVGSIPILLSCGDGDSDKHQITVENNNSGSMTVTMSDAPTDDYSAVYVTVGSVHVHKKGGGWHHVSSPHTTCNLLELVGGLRQHLGIVDLDEGHYNQLRLILSKTPDNGVNILSEILPHANYIIDKANDCHELKVPSAFSSGIKVIHGFVINENETTDLLLDFDASRSVVKAGNSGKWILKPVIRVLTESDAAFIKGRVDDLSGGAIEKAAISLQVYDRNASDPRDEVSVIAFSLTNGSGDYAIIVPPGSYNLVSTAEGMMAKARKVDLSPDTIAHEDFTLPFTDTGTLSGEVSILGGNWEQHAALSFRKDIVFRTERADEEIEVESISVANDGRYSVELAEGTYTVTASTFGWTTQEFTVTVTSGQTTTLDITF